MDQEATADLLLALHSLCNNRSFLQKLRLLADGQTLGSTLFNDLSEAKFAALDSLDDATHPQLLPPYALMCKEIILLETGAWQR